MDEISERKENLKNFLVKNKLILAYLLIIVIILVGSYIRVQNLPSLEEKYPLSIDDPFIFMRYSEIIDEQGKLPEIDYMRNYPLGYETGRESTLLAYVISYIHKITSVFDSDFTVKQAAILYPVIFFVLGLIFFFLFIKRLFGTKIALLASAFLAVVPPFLFRTMAGFSDKEPLAIFFMFSSFYFFILAIQSKKLIHGVIYGVISGILTSLMGLSWGGVGFILLIIPAFYLVAILLEKVTKRDLYIYLAWLVPYFLSATMLTLRYGGIKGFFGGSFTNSFSFLILALFLFVLFIHFKKIEEKIKLPTNITRLIIAAIILIILLLIFLGPSFFTDQYKDATNKLLSQGYNRWALTVAENNTPFFVDWISNFSKTYLLFVYAGSIFLFYEFINKLKHKKSKIILTIVFGLFLLFFSISKYSASSILNGTSTLSRILYIGSLLLFILAIAIFYFYAYYKNRELFEDFKSLDIKYVFIIIFLILNIIAARRYIRLLFAFAPATAILSSFFLIRILDLRKRFSKHIIKVIFIAIFLVLLYLTLIPFAKTSYYSASGTGTGYTPQWRAAMDWVSTETPENSVFAHWWDYGYVVQAAGKRATIVDPGNFIVYWNHLMGRHVLTAQNSTEALEFLKVHNTTHLLITEEEIGKYPAFSTIGSGATSDRLSQLSIFSNDPKLTKETRNETVFIFQGVSPVDKTFVMNDVVFPEFSSYYIGFIIPVEKINTGNNTVELEFGDNPLTVIYNKGQQYTLPLECIYYNNKEYNFNGNGVKGCLRILPSIQSNGDTNVIGSAIYLTEKVRNNLFGQMYMLNKEWPGFKLAYDDKVPLAIYQGRLIGPIKIWSINYPSNIQYKSEYLETSYPDKSLTLPL